MNKRHCGGPVKNCGTQVLPAVVHPTKCCVKHTQSNIIQPEIHPSHTTNVHHQNIVHQHYFPHTESNVTEVTNQNVVMPGPGPGFGPGMMPGPGFGPGMPGPGMGGPGFGPGMPGPGMGGPGFGPGMQGPGMPGPGFGPRPNFPF
ncbi:CotD family spore coat protein [Lederbergia graminis]|uniref:CotD family spore coat protein n=1 Tax=Lederbergia graminis TaxID=735518 RepID=A0ABW0LCA3_9BACI